jgi:hypothetical protein
VYFPTLMLMPLYEDLDQRARCVAPHSLQTPRTQGRWTWSRRTQALRARSAVTAAAGWAGARS